jgi:hypothetical protein
MSTLTIYPKTKEEEKVYLQLAKLLKSKMSVKKIEMDEEASTENTLENIKAGLSEMRLFKKGKLKTSSAKDFLNEL